MRAAHRGAGQVLAAWRPFVPQRITTSANYNYYYYNYNYYYYYYYYGALLGQSAIISDLL